MENRIQIRHGDTAPTANDLLPHELGWSDDTSCLYIKDDSNQVRVVALPDGGTKVQIKDWTGD